MLVGDYFTSPEANILFNPNNNETIIECLAHRVQILGDGMIDDDILRIMSSNEEDVIITIFGSTHLRTKYIYLKFAYGNDIQYMNDKTWLQCCQLAVDMLADTISKVITSARTVVIWNMEFRTNGTFTLSYVKDSQEPKLFQIFFGVKTEVIKHCSDGMKTGTLSTEALMNELKNAMVPNAYNTWLDDTGSVPPRMPTFEDMIYYLDLT